jgi:uncharacterized protein
VGKLAMWILLAVAVMLLVRMIGAGKRRGRDASQGQGAGKAAGGTGKARRDGETEPPGKAGELMMSCAVCGVHLPSSDAVFARGKVFCGAEHRDQDESRAKGST